MHTDNVGEDVNHAVGDQRGSLVSPGARGRAVD